jgi:hydrogenase nickel incorporation protein HypA/HybF
VHELSIAYDLIECVREQAAQRGIEHIVAVHMRLGVFSGVVKEALLFSFDVAAHGTILEGARLMIEDVPLVLHCRECGMEHTLGPIVDLRCPECGSATAEVIRGRELELMAVEVPDEDAHR